MADRNDFFFKQRVTEAELDGALSTLEIADWAIVKEIMGFGFLISGPAPATVVQNPGTPDLNVSASVFLGYDQLGRRLSNLRSGFQGGSDIGLPPQLVDLSVDEVGAPTTVASGGNEKTLAIFVEFERNLQDPRLDGNGATVFFDVDESIKFNVVQSPEASVGTSVPPPLRGDQILLADVTRIFAQTAFLNADIDQSRRENFALGLLHGASHLEGGADAIPNATGSVGGLHSASDKTAWDATPKDVTEHAALFDNQAKLFQPANSTVPSASTLDITSLMTSKDAGGSATKEGIATQSEVPNNRVILKDGDHDDFVTAANDVIYGRVTVDNETTPTAWTLSFFHFPDGGSETAYDMSTAPSHVGKTLQMYMPETYSLENLPTFAALFSVPSDQVAAEYPTPIKAQDSGGTPISGSPFSTIKEGSGVAFADAGSNVMTITATAAGVPLGVVVDWWRPNTTDAVPTGYLVCDGGAVGTIGSIFDGQNTPNLTNKFRRGVTVLAGYGGPGAPASAGADSHAHTVSSHQHSMQSHVHSLSHAHTVNSHTHGTSGSHNHAQNVSSSLSGAGTPGGPSETFDATGGTDHHHHVQSESHEHNADTPGTSGADTSNTGVSSPSDTGGASPGTDSISNVPAYVGLVPIIKVL